MGTVPLCINLATWVTGRPVLLEITMSDWTITIHGIGRHHNPDARSDANRMAAKFADDLKAAGHTVEHASFTTTIAREDLLSSTGWTRTRFPSNAVDT